ncbi:DUF3611 family protein [Ancylothrix sp. C2]|uniref:DUF3611 family protein n=1 Tax=Ancylothrix sp. D3o TaxID=2953691 RepID=UPI0021BA9822|nr:DUF3611 family protein [Ancylothrix sp. D3o]MCT7951648.1 DUF3611 family protein [Ancylothrix sp. D3o]
MQTQQETYSISPTKQRIISAFRALGWLAFWVELAFTLGSGLVLIFASSGRNFSTELNPGISIGIFWACCAVFALFANIFFAYRYTRIAKGLAKPNIEDHPSKSDTLKMLRLAVIVSLVGILLGILGAGSTVGVLVAKSVSQPPGVAITDANRIIRALDVFVVVANLNGIAAHFVGVVTSLGLLSWLQHD